MKRFEYSKAKILLFVAIVFFMGSLFGQIYVTNKLAVKGKEMVKLEARKTQLEKEISELQLKQTTYTSLFYIEEEAKKLGFVENTNYVSTIQPVSAVTASAR